MFGSLFSSCCELPFLILYARDDVAAFSFPLSPSLSPPFPHLYCSFPLCDQTQTQLEHARIRELEQSLLFEKAQAEKLLRELEDTRVIHCHLPCLQNSACPTLMLVIPLWVSFWFMQLIGFGLNVGIPDFYLVWFFFALSLPGNGSTV